MVFMMRQALISQKVRPRLFSKGQRQLVDKDPISGTIITPKCIRTSLLPRLYGILRPLLKSVSLRHLIH
jgi:hypothetical protein